MLRAFVAAHPTDWVRHLSSVELYYNATKQSSTGKSPHEVVFGCEVQLPPDMVAATIPSDVRPIADLWQEAKAAITNSQSKAAAYVN